MRAHISHEHMNTMFHVCFTCEPGTSNVTSCRLQRNTVTIFCLFQAIGSFLLFGIVCVPALVSSCGPRKCWRRKLYGKLILEEEENVLKEILRKSAKDQLTREVREKICGDQWDECFNAAAELIEASRPDVREQDEQLQRRAGAADNLVNS